MIPIKEKKMYRSAADYVLLLFCYLIIESPLFYYLLKGLCCRFPEQISQVLPMS